MTIKHQIDGPDLMTCDVDGCRADRFGGSREVARRHGWSTRPGSCGDGPEDLCPAHAGLGDLRPTRPDRHDIDPDARFRQLGERARKLCGCWMCSRCKQGVDDVQSYEGTCLAETFLADLLRREGGA